METPGSRIKDASSALTGPREARQCSSGSRQSWGNRRVPFSSRLTSMRASGSFFDMSGSVITPCNPMYWFIYSCQLSSSDRRYTFTFWPLLKTMFPSRNPPNLCGRCYASQLAGQARPIASSRAGGRRGSRSPAKFPRQRRHSMRRVRLSRGRAIGTGGDRRVHPPYIKSRESPRPPSIPRFSSRPVFAGDARNANSRPIGRAETRPFPRNAFPPQAYGRIARTPGGLERSARLP